MSSHLKSQAEENFPLNKNKWFILFANFPAPLAGLPPWQAATGSGEIPVNEQVSSAQDASGQEISPKALYPHNYI